MPPEIAKNHIYVCQSVILLYFLVVAVVFTYHTCTKPKINDSQKQLDCENLKFWLIWAPMVLVIFFFEAFTMVEIFMIHDFAYNWIDLL